MKNYKFWKGLVLGIIILLICIGLSGCSEVPVSGKAPNNINQFACAGEGDLLRFYCLLEDKDGVNTVSDGRVRLEIFDDASAGLTHLAWPQVHWTLYNDSNGETWPAVTH